MASNSASRSIPEPEWHALKDSIIGYASELPIRELVEKMREEHDFCATEAQYYRQLRKWRHRKNLTLKEWRDIFPILALLCDNEVRVVVCRKVLSRTHIERARRSSLVQSNRERQYDPSLPHLDQVDIEIRRPDGNWGPLQASDGESFNRLNQARGNFSSIAATVQQHSRDPIVNDPTGSLNMTHDSHINWSPAPVLESSDLGNPNVAGNPSVVPPLDFPAFENGSLLAYSPDRYLLDPLFILDWPNAPDSEIVLSPRHEQALSLSTTPQILDIIAPLPSLNVLNSPQNLWSSLELLGQHQQLIHQLTDGARYVSEELLISFKGYIASARLGDFYGTLIPESLGSCPPEILGVLLITLLNNFGSNSSPSGHSLPLKYFLRFLEAQRGLVPFLSYFLKDFPKYMARDLMAKLIYASVQNGNAHLLESLLQMKMIPMDAIFWSHSGPWKLSPFELAVKQMDYPIVAMLIKADAHRPLVNAEVKRFGQENVSSYDLITIIGDWRDWHNGDDIRPDGERRFIYSPFTPTEMKAMLSILYDLFTIDIRVPPNSVAEAMQYGAIDLVASLAFRALSEDHRLFFKKQPAKRWYHTMESSADYLTKHAEEECVLDLLRKFVDQCSSKGCNRCISQYRKPINDMILEADKRHFIGLIHFCVTRNLGDTEIWNRVLSTAIEDENDTMIESIIQAVSGEQRPRLASGTTSTYHDNMVQIPHATTFKKDNKTVVYRLKALCNAAEAEIMLVAATASGSMETVKDILRGFPGLKNSVMCRATANSILYDHDEIFQELQKAGADIACIKHTDFRSPLHTTVIKQHKTKFFTIVNSGLEFGNLELHSNSFHGPTKNSLIQDAILWGDKEIIKALYHFAHPEEDLALSRRLGYWKSISSILFADQNGTLDFMIDSGFLSPKILTILLGFAFNPGGETMIKKLLDGGANLCDVFVLELAVGNPHLLRQCLGNIPRRPSLRPEPCRRVLKRASEVGLQGVESTQLLIESGVLDVRTALTTGEEIWTISLFLGDRNSTLTSPRFLAMLLSELPRQSVPCEGFGKEMLKMAISMGAEGRGFVEVLLESGVVDLTNDKMEEILNAAVRSGDLKLLSDVIEKSRAQGIRRPGFGVSALCTAIGLELKNDRLCTAPSAVDLLLSNNMFSGSEGGPLCSAINAYRPGETDMVKRLLDHGWRTSTIVSFRAASNSGPQTAFCYSIEKGDLSLVSLMIGYMRDEEAEINAEATLGFLRTPLQQAVESCNIDVIKLLLEHRADPNAKAAYRGGATAFQLAAIQGRCDIAQLLLNHQPAADMHADTAKIHGRRPLEGAAEWGRFDMISYLDRVEYRFERAECERALDYAKKGYHMGCQGLLEEIMDRRDVYGTKNRISEAMATAARFA